METEQKESLESKTCRAELEEDRSVHPNSGIRIGEISTLYSYDAKMTKQHSIERIAKRQKDFKCCRGCRKINWHKRAN